MRSRIFQDPTPRNNPKSDVTISPINIPLPIPSVQKTIPPTDVRNLPNKG